MSIMPLYISDCGIATPIGCGKKVVAQSLFVKSVSGLTETRALIEDEKVLVGQVSDHLPDVPSSLAVFDCRNNRLMLKALQEIEASVAVAVNRYGAERIAVILGSSTSGIASGEDAFELFQANKMWPDAYCYSQQELSGLSAFVSAYLGLSGPAYTIATACSSSAKVFASAARMIRAGYVDAAVVGGADTLCRMTLNGFNALELLSKKPCNPFSKNRDGITIGEGASAFLLTKEVALVELLGVGETSDAHHLTAPDPSGCGAREAMLMALKQAGLKPEDVGYLNLHGTASVLNDSMEARAVCDVFGADVACSSTKGMTGHMLGATGGCEAAFLWLAQHPDFGCGHLPAHLWDGVVDPLLPPLRFVQSGAEPAIDRTKAMMSNSFGFGGSNVSLVLGKVG